MPAVGRADVVRVPGAKLGRLVRPAERRERPELRREPRVEDVLVLLQVGGAALGTRGRLRLRDGEVAVGAVPDRDPVPPPELARDAPRADRLHPAEVDVGVALRPEADAPVPDRLDRRRRELRHLAPPLERDQRLDPRAAARAVADRVAVRLRGLEELALAQDRDDSLLRLLLREPRELARLLVHAPVEADHGQLGEPVRPPDLEVHRIVPGCDLDCARAELRIDAVVGDDRNAALGDGHDRLLADRDRGSARRRDGRRRRRPRASSAADRRDREVPGAVGQRVPDREEAIVDLAVLDLEIGDCARAPRAPVDDPVVAVEEAALVEMDEVLEDRADVPVVHREPLAAVVERRAEPAELTVDHPAVVLEPAPGALARTPRDRDRAASALPSRGRARRRSASRSRHGRSPAARGSRTRACGASGSSEILDRRVQGVAHVQLAGDVRRRDAR